MYNKGKNLKKVALGVGVQVEEALAVHQQWSPKIVVMVARLMIVWSVGG